MLWGWTRLQGAHEVTTLHFEFKKLKDTRAVRWHWNKWSPLILFILLVRFVVSLTLKGIVIVRVVEDIFCRSAMMSDWRKFLEFHLGMLRVMVIAKRGSLWEPFAANSAGIRSFSGVSSLMALQIWGPFCHKRTGITSVFTLGVIVCVCSSSTLLNGMALRLVGGRWPRRHICGE